ncbi:FMN-binding negative transcriptional regulator [Actinomyces weissii]|uniref:FMN-binding negative transcriptional regulator n=1 Tax=Actinomyces weissii TaxID=675090 RepID=A0A7T7S2Y8_9ACTO|nr:FMN-binding negative transcriptional regulator [Actinomyces weissii]QQM68190.1 FMN-binding negative transcriptional regulator [Actinomyces weissii]
MYVPGHFQLSEEHVRQVLATPRTGNLVTVHAFGPEATLVPLYLDTLRDVLVTHLVRNNPQAREPLTGPGLVVLDQVDTYVSPLWYATNSVKANVPTWDYVTVHVRGQVRVDPDPAAALAAARRLTELSEDSDVLSPVGEEQLERMARAIVAVEVSLDEVRGKAKMSQNRHPDDIISLAAELERQGETQMAQFLREVSLPYAQERFQKLAALGDTARGRAVAAARAGQTFH